MLDTKRFVMLGALLFLIVGIVGVVSLFDTNGEVSTSVTGATIADVGLTESTDVTASSVCHDLDGKNEYLASSVLMKYSDGSEKEYRDVCINNSDLLEYICVSDEVQSVKIRCETSCSKKACVE